MTPILFVLLLAAGAPDAKDIATKAQDAGQADAISEKATMTLVDKGGAKRVRTMRIVQKKTGAHEWSARIEFLDPKDVAGTVLLTVGDDQHLYLPGIHRVRRVSGGQKSGSFQGSDFAYEDLAQKNLDQADYTLLPDEKIGDRDCFVLQATPHKDADTSYAKTIADVAKDDYVTLRVRFFDASGAELKRLDVDPSKILVKGTVRIPQHVEMTTAKDGHKTLLDVTDVDLAPKIDAGTFDPASLDKG